MPVFRASFTIIGLRGRDCLATLVHCAHSLRSPAFSRPPFACSRTLPPEFVLQTKKVPVFRAPFTTIGGEAEIRTLGGIAPTTVFKTAALNHSAISPLFFTTKQDNMFRVRSHLQPLRDLKRYRTAVANTNAL